MTSHGQDIPAQSGLQQLSLAMRPELRRFLRARGCSEADAEDLLQELFIKIATTTTGPIRTPKAYLFQILNNMAHTRRRTEMRRQARDAEWIGERRFGDDADAAPDPETALAGRDELERVEAQLADLPERTAFVFRQYRVEGHSQKAIALELGISLSAVEKHLQRAYKAVLVIRNRQEQGGLAPASSKGGIGDAVD
ncbi:RNA polymerase sigma factor [uncultured Novosphingobium sp.]|uniref:RNA polymerase sigma factor n=1 Tax=Novosphingobium fluoreni TaxID=1391222 RepID=UPI0007370F0E|nr:RNA polymerase sigma factor [uncultured Novosphingobium sp.]KTR84442.1 RNA polymerase subunit sigma-24 [Novosphingobium barchaimii]